MNLITIFIAQTTPGPAPTPSSGAAFFPIALMLGLVAFMLLSSRSQKKREKREREEMFGRLAKNDRVQTIGGIIGTVSSVRDTEVVLKVDEATNTKITVLKTAIQRLLTDSDSASSSTK